MPILVIAEHDNRQLKTVTASAVTAASQCGGPVEVLVMGYKCESVAREAAQIGGVSRVLLADSLSLKDGIAENAAEQILAVAAPYSHVLACATVLGRGALPRVAARLDVELVSEVIQVVSPDTFKRPVYAGNAIATVKSSDSVKILTIRPTTFMPAGRQDGAAIEPVGTITDIGKVVCLSRQIERTGRPDLADAKVIVAGGQGVGSAENFRLLEAFADRLGAAVGASRAAVDAGYAKNDLQIGQTGKIVAPELYFAIGISGAIQHVAGIKDAKTIVAINQDLDAPIFLVSDYGLVGDWQEIVPELMEKLPAGLC
ncbi:MAG: FAD-binding protein [Alistipes senegalensis]|nr:FAD-binding protein [Oxalobacter formigenes]MCM1281707.1 FAD-binding protein [Alistipes senegalensis]